MKAYFFDLDGTLTDSRAGLFPSFQAALASIGVPAAGEGELNWFLGTPLPEMFRHLRPDISDAEIDVGMAAFRSIYERDGIKQNCVYAGVVEMLDAVRRRGAATWVVTSKPDRYAVQVVRDLGLAPYVAGVVGAGLDENDTKADLIGRALAAAKVAGSEAIMLGDRHYDITGALAMQVLPVGALWGYGSHDELSRAGCRIFSRSPEDFRLRFVDGREGAAAHSRAG